MNNGTTLDLNNGNIFDSKVMHPVTNPDIPTGDRRVDSQDHLYGGNEALTIPPTAGSTHTVNLVSGHVEMMVEVVGFEEVYATTRQGSAELELEHRGLPSYTDFSGNVTTNERLSQFPPRRRVVEEEDEDDSIYSHEYQVMRGVRGSTIHLYNGEEEIFTLDVEEYVQEHLMPNPNIPGPYDANGILLNEAYIPIRIEITDPGDDEEDDDDEDDEDDEEEDPGDDDDPEDPDPEDPDEIDVVFTVSIPNWALQDVTPEF
jgi:hypothetical protein